MAEHGEELEDHALAPVGEHARRACPFRVVPVGDYVHCLANVLLREAEVVLELLQPLHQLPFCHDLFGVRVVLTACFFFLPLPRSVVA